MMKLVERLALYCVFVARNMPTKLRGCLPPSIVQVFIDTRNMGRARRSRYGKQLRICVPLFTVIVMSLRDTQYYRSIQSNPALSRHNITYLFIDRLRVTSVFPSLMSTLQSNKQ